MRYTMKEKCLIDTSLLLEVILEGEAEVLRKLSEYILHVPVNVLEESSFSYFRPGFQKTKFFGGNYTGK
jgi:hypothetical protein